MFNLKFNSLIFSLALSILLPLTTLSAANVTTYPPREEQPSTFMEKMTKTKENVLNYFKSDPSSSTIAHTLQAAELSHLLNDKDPVTIFVPNNSALTSLPSETFKKIFQSEGRDEIRAIFKAHVVPQKITQADLKTMKVKAVSGDEIDIQVNGPDVTVNGAKVIRSEPLGDNGIIYVIDKVLIPKQSATHSSP
jgi:uncharacterized surface protein with fasciclin (FAS1) repeats